MSSKMVDRGGRRGGEGNGLEGGEEVSSSRERQTRNAKLQTIWQLRSA
jgi:hypothetical protein